MLPFNHRDIRTSTFVLANDFRYIKMRYDPLRIEIERTVPAQEAQAARKSMSSIICNLYHAYQEESGDESTINILSSM